MKPKKKKLKHIKKFESAAVLKTSKLKKATAEQVVDRFMKELHKLGNKPFDLNIDQVMARIKADTKTAPAKPTTKPGTKPNPGRTSPIPTTRPEVKPKPKAYYESIEADTKTAPAKPTTKPGIKPNPGRTSPIPTTRPEVKPRPKAMQEEEELTVVNDIAENIKDLITNFSNSTLSERQFLEIMNNEYGISNSEIKYIVKRLKTEQIDDLSLEMINPQEFCLNLANHSLCIKDLETLK